MVLANISNGLAFPHDDVCYFQSNHAHHYNCGYFRIDAMPHSAIIALLRGKSISIVDATRRHKPLTDAQKFGVPMFCLVFNRAIRKQVFVCQWQTPEMTRLSYLDYHKPLVNNIRKLEKYYGHKKPLIIGENVNLICHQNFIADDKPKRLKKIIYENT